MLLSICFHIPMPPSVNALFRNVAGVGRVRTTRYKKWATEAGWSIKSQTVAKLKGPYALSISVPQNARADLDGLLKGPIDLLVSLQITPDDKFLQKLEIKRADVKDMEIQAWVMP